MRQRNIFTGICLLLFLTIAASAQSITNYARPDNIFAAGSLASVDDVRMVEEITYVPVNDVVYEVRGAYVTVDGIRARLTSVSTKGTSFIVPALNSRTRTGRFLSARRDDTANVEIHTESGQIFTFIIRLAAFAPGFYPAPDGTPFGFQFVNGYQFLDYRNVIPASRGFVQVAIRVNGFLNADKIDIFIGPYQLPVQAYPDPVFAGYETAVFSLNSSVPPGIYTSYFSTGREYSRPFTIVIQ